MEPIAIIGFAFKLPAGAGDESSLWTMLQEARNVMTEYPSSRVNIDAFYSPERKRNNTLYSKGAHFLDVDPAAFDAPFFSITKDEAASMDPQARHMMQVSYHALENAGLPMEKAAGSDTAVYVSTMANDFEKMRSKDPDTNLKTAVLGTASSVYAGRLSWFFDFRGPCLHVDTACSSSLVGVDLACQTLRNGRSSMALVVGSSLILSPEVSIAESNMQFLSPESQCASFTSRANGYGRGEGVVALVLKRVSDALVSGDMIRAVIRGTGSSHDGRTQGIGRPRVEGQEALITRVYKDAALDLAKTRYFEAHGTGTSVGDPTEMKAIGRVFRTSRSSDEPLYVGSIKANIGHIEAGSGIAGIIKAVLVLERGIIPPNALLDNINTEIDMDFYNLKIPMVCTPWPAKGLRRASTSSFGLGGSNAHVILDDARHYLEERGLLGHHRTVKHPPGLHNGQYTQQLYPNSSIALQNIANGHATNGSTETSKKTQLLVFAAKDETSLKRMVQTYGTYYISKICYEPEKLKQLAYTLAEKRSRFAWRSFAVVSSVSTSRQPFAVDSCNNNHTVEDTKLDVENIHSTIKRADDVKLGIAFIFTGQGAQYIGMGQKLLVYTVFTSTLHNINDIYQDLGAEWDVTNEINEGANINTPEYSQPLCTAIQIALVELLKSWNTVPLTVVGHSSGEIAAAYAIGALTLRSACAIAYWRGKLASLLAKKTSRPGAMLSVNLSEPAANEYLSAHGFYEAITIACINSPSNVTVSGPAASIESFRTQLAGDSIQAFEVRTGVAYHSPAMNDIAREYLERLSNINEESPRDVLGRTTKMISTVTGEPISPSLVSSAQYWVDNLVSPVRFVDAVQLMAKVQWNTRFKLDTQNLRPVYDVIEIGPHATLRRPIIDTLKQNNNAPGEEIRYSSILNRMKPNIQTSLEVIGRLFTYGYPVNIAAANATGGAQQMPPFLVNTPEYPFDESQHYWSESRLSRDFRLRGGGTVEGILGVRASDWNPLEPRWRKFVSIEDMPWVGDHMVTEAPLFPAAGMIVIALAAVQASSEIQHSGLQPSAQISGFHIKEASFLRPIIVRSRVELLTQIRPLRNNHGKYSKGCEVQIFTYIQTDEAESGTWTESFRAEIQTQYVSDNTKVDGGLEARLKTRNMREEFRIAKQNCTESVSKDAFYAYHAAHGLRYGPSFQLVHDLCWDTGRTAMGSVYDALADRPTGALVHPATLDAAFQICMTAACSKGVAHNNETLIPNRLFDGFVSATGWQHANKSQLQVLTTSEPRAGGKGLDCRIMVLNNNGRLLFDANKLQTSPIGRDTKGNGSPDRKLLYGIKWEPLISMMNREQISNTCQTTSVASEEDLQNQETAMVEFQGKLESMIFSAMKFTLAEISGVVPVTSPNHVHHYITWMQRQLLTQQPEYVPSNHMVSKADLDIIGELLVASKPSWRLFVTIARNLTSILLNKINPLELMFSTGEAETFYADICTHICAKVSPFFALAAHENPTQRILEVGAGTGSMTSNILSILQEHERATGAQGFSQYTYTDISPAFFDAAQTRFAHPNSDGRVVFKTLDLDQGISEQGFQSGSYDMIIAGSVLHATSSLSSSLQNLRQALKPGGKLVFLEITAPKKIVWNFTFGILPDWWRSEQAKHTSSPAADEEAWNILLRKSGFSGNDLVVRDWNDSRCHNFSLIISTANQEIAGDQAEQEKNRVVFVIAGSEYQHALAEELAQEVNKQGIYTCRIISLSSILEESIFNNDIVVFLPEIESPLLDNVDELDFERLKSGLLRSKRLLWVGNAAPTKPSYSFQSLSTGLLRSLRSEDVGKCIVTLTIEDTLDLVPSSAVVLNIVKIFRASFEIQSREVEYAVRNNQIYTPRLCYEESLDAGIRAAISPSLRLEPWSSEIAVKVSAAVPGNLESLQFDEDLEYGTDLGPRDIEVEAKAWGLSFRDLFLALGRLEEDDYGFECAGTVTRVGSECTHLSLGDRVCMTAKACMRQYARCEEREAFRIPTSMSFEDAASIAGPALTAVYTLVEVARLRRGEKILIHSASGATGQVAVMLAQALGAEVYCTVGNEDKKQFLIDRFGILSDHILDSRGTSFAPGIKRLTKGYGVDVLLSSLSGDGLFAGWECMAPYGRFIEIGKADIISNGQLPMGGFKHNVTFAAVDFYHITRFRKDITQSTLTKVIKFINEGKLRAPNPITIYPVSRIEEAFRYFQSGRHVGRIVIVPQHGELVPKYSRKLPTWHFDANASYLIVGGFGGLGRAILPWMVAKGARHLIVLSRSGPTSTTAAKTVAQLEMRGIQLYAPKCDVSSASDLREALREAKERLPPIKGCINAAMVLRDTLFANMSHAQWLETIRSKVNCSTHLSSLLPNDLDFFILLSSLAGIYGTAAQSNYAAGCTSQDALARQRVTQGLKAVSLDVGWMRTVGVVAESELYQRVREREADMQQIEEDEFLAILNIYCDPRRGVGHVEKSQVLIGPVIPADVRAKGVELPHILERPLFNGFDKPRGTNQDSSCSSSTQLKPSALFRTAKTFDERADIITNALVNKIARASAIPPSEINTNKPLLSYGVDSLVAVELRNWIMKEFGREIAVFDIMGGSSIMQISAYVSGQGL